MFHFFEIVNKGHLKCSMSTIKNDKISLHCHFNKTINGPGTGFQSPTLNQKHIGNV